MITIKLLNNKTGFEEKTFNDPQEALKSINYYLSTGDYWAFINGSHTNLEKITETMVSSSKNIIISPALNGG